MAWPFDGRAPSRRDFLRGAAALGGGVALANPLFDRVARAMEEGSDRYFVFVYLGGGIDVLCSLDPRDPDRFAPERQRETGVFTRYAEHDANDFDGSGGGYPSETASGMLVGPYLRASKLYDHIDRVALVRGLNMETLSHTGGAMRFNTGKVPQGDLARGSSLATHLAAELAGGSNLMPNLSFGLAVYNRDREAWASAVSLRDTDDLVKLLRAATPRSGTTALSSAEEEGIAMLLAQHADCRNSCASPTRTALFDSFYDVNTLIDRRMDMLFDFRNAATLAQLNEHYNPGSTPITSASFRPSTWSNAAGVVNALTSGLSRCVSVRLTGNFDHHDESGFLDFHGNLQRTCFDQIAAMIRDLERRPYVKADGSVHGDWMDHVTFLVYSEFSRTPLKGFQGGRDHHLMNGCMLLGADVRGNRAFNASSDVGMMPMGCDLATGVADPHATQPLKPDHVLQGLLHSAGITTDVADLRVPPLAAPFASLT
jgi:uncharacterized protein (DUF1501 family)